MVQAAASALLGAFSGQSHREPIERPQIQSALPALAQTTNTRTANKIRKEAREERLYNALMQPEVLGFAMALGGLAIANNIPFSSDQDKNTILQAIASTMSVAMGMGYAGVGDLTSLSVALAAGSGSLFGGLLDFDELGNITGTGGTSFFDVVMTGLNPIYPIFKLFS